MQNLFNLFRWGLSETFDLTSLLFLAQAFFLRGRGWPGFAPGFRRLGRLMNQSHQPAQGILPILLLRAEPPGLDQARDEWPR